MSFNNEEQEIIRWGALNGKSKDEIRMAIINYRSGVSPEQPSRSAPTEQEPSFTERVAGDIATAGERVSDAIAGEGEFEGRSPIRRGAEAAATAANAIPQVAMETLPEPAREGLSAIGEKLGNLFRGAVDKISDVPALQSWVSQNPDAARSLEEVAGTLSATGQVAGNVLGAKGATATTKAASDATVRAGSNLTEGLADASKTGVSAVRDASSKALDPSGIMQRVARISKGKQAKFEKRAGESIGEYLTTRNIFGTPDQIADQLLTRMRESKARVDQSLASIRGTSRPDVVKTALSDLMERDAKVSTSGALSGDSTRIVELFKRFHTKGLTISEINEVKRLFERNVRVDYINPTNPKPEQLVRANNIDSALRNLVEDKAAKSGVNVVRELNRETSLAKQLLDDIGAEYAGSAGNNAVTLTDWILLAEATGNPAAAAGFIAKKTLGSKAIMAKIAKALSPKTSSKKLPEAQVVNPTMSGYLEFLNKTTGR